MDRFGDREALVVRHQNVRFTYNQQWDQTMRCARGLLAHGVGRVTVSESGHRIDTNGWFSSSLPRVSALFW